MEIKELTCIQCPMGCQLTVKYENGEWSVSGNTCPRGEAYGKKEVSSPTRTVTSTVRVIGGDVARVSVKTAHDIPKAKIFDIMDAVKSCTVNAPVHMGDVLIPNAAGSGSDVIATKEVAKK